MAETKVDKNNIIVCGYLRETINKYTPNIIIYNIILFFKQIMFNVFNEKFIKLNNDNNGVREWYHDGLSTFLITNDNKLHIYGDQRKYIKFFDDRRIAHVSSGWSLHAFACTCDNKLYGFGFGIKALATPTESPVLIDMSPLKSKLKYIKCGGQHTLFLTINGNVYGYGDNRHNELLLDERRLYYKITPIKALNNITNISCLYVGSIVLDINGKLKTFGIQNSHNEWCGIETVSII